MKALQIKAFGDVSGLTVVDLADPRPTPDTAVVRVEAASINPSDVKNVQGAMRQTTLPRVPGRDYAGVVESGPAEWVGVPVWGTGGDAGFTRDGTHAQKLAVPVASLRRKPERLSFDQAASIGVNYLAAWIGVVESAQLQRGETLAVVGAGGGVGGAAAQIAKRLGARVIGLDNREPHPDAPIRAIAETLLIAVPDAGAAIRGATGGRGADVVFDTVGGVLFRQALAALAHRGRLVEISSTGTREVTFDLVDFYHNESRLFGVDTLKRDLVASAEVLGALAEGFDAGDYRAAPILASFGLAEAPAAYRRVADGAMGRIVLHPQQ
ncbi:MAG: quinone oxidoreductase family protein [Myxococcaceae bacterium]